MKKNKKIFLLIIAIFICAIFFNLNYRLGSELKNSPYQASIKLISTLNAQQCQCYECNCNVNIPNPLPVSIENISETILPVPIKLEEINPNLLPIRTIEDPASPIYQYYNQLVNRDLLKFEFSQYVQEAVLFYLTSARTSCEYFMKIIDAAVIVGDKNEKICRNVVENWGNFLEDIPKNVRLETAKQVDTAAGLDPDLKEELINNLGLTLEEYELYPKINPYENLILKGTQGTKIEDTESIIGSFTRLVNPFYSKQGLYNITKNYLDQEQVRAEKVATLEAQSGSGVLSSQECVAEAIDTTTGKNLGCVKYRANVTEQMAKTSVEKAITYDLDAIINSTFPLEGIYQSAIMNVEKNDQGIWQGGTTLVKGLLNALNTTIGTNTGIFSYQPIVPTQGEDIYTPIGTVPPVIPTTTPSIAPGPITPTPGPITPTPGPITPSVDLRMDNSDERLTKYAPANIVLSWNSSNASFCEASGNWSGRKELNGCQQVQNINAGNYNYTLTCKNTNQTATASDQVSLQVIIPTTTPPFSPTPLPSGVPYVDLKIDNSYKQLTTHDPANIVLSWNSLNASSCEAFGNWSGPKSLNGCQQIQNINEGNYRYTLTCRNKNQTATTSDSVNLQVIKYITCNSDNDCSYICAGDSTCSALCKTAPEISGLRTKVCWRTRQPNENYEPRCTSWTGWGDCSKNSQTRWCTSGPAVYQIRTCQ